MEQSGNYRRHIGTRESRECLDCIEKRNHFVHLLNVDQLIDVD